MSKDNIFLQKKRNNNRDDIIYISDEEERRHSEYKSGYKTYTNKNLQKDLDIITNVHEIIMRFVHYIKRFVDLDYQTYISNLNITINEKMKEFSPSKRSRIFYGFDEIYSITYFMEFLSVFKNKINSFSKDSQLHQVDLNKFKNFAKFFEDKTTEDFFFLSDKNYSIISLLKKELLMYFFLYPQMLINASLYECFKIRKYSYDPFDYFISLKEIEEYATSPLYIGTLFQLLTLQNLFTCKDTLPKKVKYILAQKKIYYVGLPKEITSFSLINGTIIVNNKFSDYENYKKNEIQRKAILIVILLGQIANLICKELYHDLSHVTYFQNFYFVDNVHNYESITCFDWMCKCLFADTNEFTTKNSTFICNYENFVKIDWYKTFKEKLEEINKEKTEEKPILMVETEKFYWKK